MIDDKHHGLGHHHHHKHLLVPVKILLMLILGVWLVVLIRNDLKEYNYIGQPSESRDVITITGEGKVTAIPDIAVIQLGIYTEKREVAEAQTENTRKMNEIVAALKKLEIEAKDIRTSNYSINPQYDYSRGERKLRGYAVNQNVTIKIRDLDSLGNVLATATELGANQAGGLQFTIDEPETLRQQAREMALAQAKEKAEALARVAGVKLGKITAFSESGATPPPMPLRSLAVEEVGIGGGLPSPSIEPGSTEITVVATVSYEIL